MTDESRRAAREAPACERHRLQHANGIANGAPCHYAVCHVRECDECFDAVFVAGNARVAALEAVAEALRIVLPMAKGYAAANPVGRNADMIAQAEDDLKDLDAKGESDDDEYDALCEESRQAMLAAKGEKENG